MTRRGATPHARPAGMVQQSTEGGGLIPILVGLICASEVVLVFVNLAAGVLLEASILAIILWLQAARAGRIEGRAMIPLALVPLLRLLSLTMPLPGVPPVYSMALSGVPLVVGGVLAARASGLTRSAVGLGRTGMWTQLAIALLGLPAGLALWLYIKPTSLIGDATSLGDTVGLALMLALFMGVTEEFIFRGVIQAGLAVAYANGAVLLTAILYGSSYLGTLSFEYASSMTVIGLLFGLIVRRTGSIVGASASHATMVVGAFLAWPALLG
jgi:membrane protease YdiL (CAAX protease family)